MNNKDQLEKFIRDNRKEFDAGAPSPDVWEQLSRRFPGKVRPKQFSRAELIRWTTAAALIVALLSTLYFLYIKDSHEKQTVSKNNESQSMEPLNETADGIRPEYAVMLERFTASVEERQQALKEAASGLPALYSQFARDLEVLDSSYRSLKQQASQTPNRDVLIRAMIQNLQLQASLLERQLQVIQEFKTIQKTNNEKTI